MRSLPVLALALLVGCAEEAPYSADIHFVGDAWGLHDGVSATDRAPAPGDLTMTPTASVPTGELVTFTVSGANPGANVGIVAGRRVDPGANCPGALDTCLDVGPKLYLVGTATADGSGNASVDISLPCRLPPGDVAFQAAAPNGGVDSDTSAATLLTVETGALCDDRLPDNGSFETGDFTGWTVDDMTYPFIPLVVMPAGFSQGYGFFSTAPTDGNFSVVTGWDGYGPDQAVLSQVIELPNAASVQLTFDWRAAWRFYGGLLDRTFSVEIYDGVGGTLLDSQLIATAVATTAETDTGIQSESIDLTAYAGSTIEVAFVWRVPEPFTGPAQFELDNVTVSN